jgi:flagellar motility protein MotE (MotC chaperone)
MFRLLPIISLLCVALLGLRIADIVQRQQSLPAALFIEPLSAEDKEVLGEEEEAKEEGDESDEAAKADAPPAEELVRDATKKDAPQFSKTELDILQRLSERRKKLEEWEKEIEVKERLLRITESKIDHKIVEMRDLKEEVETLLTAYNREETEKIKSLVKIYQNMKPKDAARIFEQLDMPILLRVLSEMKERSASPILAQMNPARAKEVTIEFANQSKLSPPDGL